MVEHISLAAILCKEMLSQKKSYTQPNIHPKAKSFAHFLTGHRQKSTADDEDDDDDGEEEDSKEEWDEFGLWAGHLSSSSFPLLSDSGVRAQRSKSRPRALQLCQTILVCFFLSFPLFLRITHHIVSL